MAWTATVQLECDDCGTEVDEDLDRSDELNTSAENVIDAEGWSWSGSLSDKLLCPDCAEKEDA